MPVCFTETKDSARECFERCLKLETGTTKSVWKPLTSPFPDVKMSISRTSPKRGTRTIATGKASVIVDTTVRRAAAYWFSFTSSSVFSSNEERYKHW